MRLPAAPRMRIYAVPVPKPFSPQAKTPGVLAKSMGNSRPVFEKSRSSCLPTLLTAKGASFDARTAFTTTVCN